jgi:2'-5' RNA ligase
MRLFAGLPLPPLVIDQLAAISQRLRSSGDGLRWSAPESWHITLQFLGNASWDQYECAVAQLRGVHLPPVSIQLDGLGFFDRASIFFAGVKVSPELSLLQERVIAATELCGFVPETRPFAPHITLARHKGMGQRQGLLALKTKLRELPWPWRLPLRSPRTFRLGWSINAT